MTAVVHQHPAAADDDVRSITVLGATGSVGTNTLDLIGRHPDRYSVRALTANTNYKDLALLAIRHQAEVAVLADESRYHDLKSALAGTGIEAAAGAQALVEAAARPVDLTMAAIVGAAGMRPAFEALKQGNRLALANKECLVAAGDVFMREVRDHGAELLPVDSEHSAAFQAIDETPSESIERIILTASGGPFRTWPREKIETATPEQALQHPNWRMGRKVTIDSATLMNKGLELIEAWHLFPVEADQLDVLIHPQSIIHCLVEYEDGSVLAQMSSPDMRTPIAYSLAWPKRMPSPTKKLDLISVGELSFEKPDDSRFPALRLARTVLKSGGNAPTVLNAANEIAVEAYLDNLIQFKTIPLLCEQTIERVQKDIGTKTPASLDEVLTVDGMARRVAKSSLPQ